MDINNFIDSNSFNVQFQFPTHQLTEDDHYVVYPKMFSENIDYDTINRDLETVYVYLKNGEPVAWFNCKQLYGYIKV